MALWYISHPMILSSVNCGLKTYCDIAWFCVFQIICSTENHVRIQEGKQIKIIIIHQVKRLSLHTSLVAHQAGAYPGFSSMKRLGVFLLPPGWDASPSQGYPQHQIRRYPFIHLGGERHCESEVSCPRTQHNVPGQGSNPERSLRSRAH